MTFAPDVPQVEGLKLTAESDSLGKESKDFSNLVGTRTNEKAAEGSFSVGLERGKGSIRSRTLRVEKGQKITLEVQARYDNEKVLQPLSRAANSKEIAKAAILGVGAALSVQDIVVGGETKGKSLNFNVLGIVPFVKNLFKKPAKYDVAVPYQPQKPTSYVEIAIYSDSLLTNLVGKQQQFISEKAEYQWENLQDSLVFESDGFAVVSLRNESEKEVLFDELNVRVYGTEKAVIIQENHYEPFGMTLKGLDYVVNEKHKNNFLFGGKELTEDLGLEGYDFVNRGYDPQKGSFNQIDPLADKMRRYSPYVYCFDNPMRYVDPDGMEPEDVSDDRKTRRYQRRQNKFNEKIKAFQEKLNTISQSVVNGELDQAGLDDAVKSLNKDFSKLNKAYKKLNASKVQGKILTPINQSLKIAGGFDKAYSNGNNTIGLNPASGNTQSSSYAYLSNLTNDKGQAVTLNQNSTVLSTTLTVNIEMQGQANISIFGATSMPVGGGLTGVNSLVNRVQNGSSSDTFSNAAPATPANTVGLTNPNSLAGFGVTANPVNNSQATGNININLQVNYFTPLRVEGYTH